MDYPLAPPTPLLGIQYYTVFAIIWQRQLKHNYIANRTPLPLKSSYDFVVVGAGSAGCVVACRLAQWGKEVLLLEAGGPQDALMTDHPGMVVRSIEEDGYKLWPYANVPQPRAGQAYASHSIPEIKGRMLGGTSSINFMVYNRGNRKAYDQLVTKFGAIGWDYDSLLPLFKRAENNSDLTVDNYYHGRTGPLGITTPPLPDPIQKHYIQAAKELGFQYNDVNGPTQTGIWLFQAFVKQGIRASTANGYIESGICPRLTVVTRALVTKVNIDFDQNRVPTATGVQFIKQNKTYCVGANKEVILSAGAIGSPHLLLLSGIGPQQHLKQVGIPKVYADLPVGDNYVNHITIINNAIMRSDDLVNPQPLLETQQMYQANVLGTGLLAQAPLTSLYYSTSLNQDNDYPDINVYGLGAKKNYPSFTTLYQFNERAEWEAYIQDLNSNDYFLILPVFSRPRSKGTIRLNTTNISDIPLINPNFLGDPYDQKVFLEAVADTFRFIERTSLSKYAYVNPTPIPGCSYCEGIPVSECISYLKCFIREYAISDYHPVGAVRMGDPRRPDTVVDPRLRVKGVNNLRVVDTSIYSHVINANTNACAVVAGEKGAELIYEDN